MYSYEANGRGNTSATDAKLLERKSQFINLPAVTPEDDGTVLGVADGKWQPVPGGGGGAEVIIFTASLDEGYLALNDGKTAGDIGEAFDNNIGRVFIEEDGVLYLVMANPATYSGRFAVSPEYSLRSYGDPNIISFNKYEL